MKNLFKILLGIALMAIAYTTATTEVVDPTLVLATGPAFAPAVLRDPATGAQVPAFTRAQQYLFNYLTRKSQSTTKQALNASALVFDPVSYVIRAAITGLSGRQKILSETNSKQIGVTNFDRGLLKQYYNFCFDKITIRYAAVNSVNFPTVQTVEGYSSVLSSMTGGLRNGNLIIVQNQNTILDTPIADFGAEAAVSGGGSRDFGGGYLQEPKVLEENKQVEIWLDLAATIPSATNTIYAVEVVLQGVQARINA